MDSQIPFVYPESLDIKRLTPDSTAGSSKRFFTNSLSQSGESREFNVAGLEESLGTYKTYTNRSLTESTRGAIGKMYLTSSDPPQQKTFDRRDLPSRTKSIEPEQEKAGRCLPKLLLFMVVTVVFIAGIVVLVISQKDSKPEAQVGSIIEDEQEDETDPVTGGEIKGSSSLLIVPPPYVNRGQTITVQINTVGTVNTVCQRPKVDTTQTCNVNKAIVYNINDSDWTASLDITGFLNLTGPLATCSSAGTYRLEILNSQNTSLYSAESILMVKSEVLQVNVSLNQSISNSSNGFTVGCSTNSGCEQSFVDFFAEINKEEQYLRGVNFTCVINYNDYDGYSVSCIGTIPDFLMAQFGKITCRPRSSLLDNYTAEEIQKLEQVLELPECDISTHCGYTCLEMGDYFVVNSGRCDIFHRCYEGQVFSEYCAPGTFFDPVECACRHVTDLAWCQSNGALKTNLYQDITPKECHTEDP